VTGQLALPGIEHEAARRLFDRLNQARANNGGQLSRDEWLAIAAAQFKAEQSVCKKPRVVNGRNPLFDALALACGVQAAGMTRAAARACAVALADVLAVYPATTEADIKHRVSRYREKHPSWPVTPPAVAKHWGSLCEGDPTRTAKHDIYQEPRDWLKACVALYGEDVGGQIHAKGWIDVRVNYGPEILRWLAK
jgi:hypothetical protein